MEFYKPNHTRREFLRILTLGGASALALKAFPDEALRFMESGDFADELAKTPSLTEGPFYPNRLPLDRDNDLIVIGSSTTLALGTITHLRGKVMDIKGTPLAGMEVEIWQVDNHGAYLHTGSLNREKADKNFQGFGRFLTDKTGEYYFRTIKPVAYPGRAPHIHMKIKKGSRELLTTQCHVKGDPGNANDGVLNSLRDSKARQSVIVAFDPLPASKAGELAARFDIVLGFTPES